MPRPAVKHGIAVAIDIGWRRLPTGVRVAYWVDEVGQHGEVLLPERDLEAKKKIDDLRSICDTERDRFLPKVVKMVSAAGADLTEEWRARASFIEKWRSAARLARLVRFWENNRLPGDDELLNEARRWRKQYLHLSNWWRNAQDQLCGRIKDQYRVKANELTQKYGTVILEDFDMREVIEQSEPESEDKQTVNRYRQTASPGTFRLILNQTSRREGLEIVKLPAEYTTIICHQCYPAGVMPVGEAAKDWDTAASLIHTCPKGHRWDQDFNAAKNLLARWRSRLGGNKTSAVA